VDRRFISKEHRFQLSIQLVELFGFHVILNVECCQYISGHIIYEELVYSIGYWYTNECYVDRVVIVLSCGWPFGRFDDV